MIYPTIQELVWYDTTKQSDINDTSFKRKT